MQMKTFKNSDEEFIKAVKECESIAGVLRALKLNPFGASYRGFRIRVKQLGLDTSHFTGAAHLRGKTHNWGKKMPITDFLIENSTSRGSSGLKKRLIKEGYFTYICSECGIDSWNAKPLSLQMDHINGCNTDNRLENLRLLCPNCHSQTPTFCRKIHANTISNRTKESKTGHAPKIRTKAKELRKIKPPRPIKFCQTCSKQIRNEATTCKACMTRPTKIEWPNCETLIAKLAETSYRALGRELGVSDNAIRKHIRNHGRV